MQHTSFTPLPCHSPPLYPGNLDKTLSTQKILAHIHESPFRLSYGNPARGQCLAPRGNCSCIFHVDINFLIGNGRAGFCARRHLTVTMARGRCRSCEDRVSTKAGWESSHRWQSDVCVWRRSNWRKVTGENKRRRWRMYKGKKKLFTRAYV